MVKFPNDEPREFLSTSNAVWGAVDSVYSAYENQRKDNPGKVPVLKCPNVIESKLEKGTSFIPVLVIDRWVPRPADLPAPPKDDPRKPVKPTRTGGVPRVDMDEPIPF